MSFHSHLNLHLLIRLCSSHLQQFIVSASQKLSYRPLISYNQFFPNVPQAGHYLIICSISHSYPRDLHLGGWVRGCDEHSSYRSGRSGTCRWGLGMHLTIKTSKYGSLHREFLRKECVTKKNINLYNIYIYNIYTHIIYPHDIPQIFHYMS